MKVEITYTLTEAGRKADILAGGDGKFMQCLAVEREHPCFAKVVELGEVTPDGNVLLLVSSWKKSFDRPQTVEEIIACVEEHNAKEAEAKIVEAAKWRQEAQEVLDNKRTKVWSRTYVSLDREGQQVDDSHKSYITLNYDLLGPDWPYNAEAKAKDIIESAAAKVWQEEIKEANRLRKLDAFAQAETMRQEKLVKDEEDKRQQEAAAADYLRAVKEAGGKEGDLLLKIEQGALCEVPEDCWESHKRGKNWFAYIQVNPAKPGGLERQFFDKAKGSFYYLVPNLRLGDPVEFGADYYSGSGRRGSKRWYGFVVAYSDSFLLLRPCANGKAACKAAEKYLETVKVKED